MRITVNGVSLFFDTEGTKLVPRGTSLQARPTVVALHGGPGVDHAGFRPHLSPLAEAAQVVYLDLRGNGRSDASTPDRWNLATWADDVHAFCEALHIERPVVLGLSFGGFVAQAYATRHPEHPGGLILCSTSARFDLERSLAQFERVGGSGAAGVARRFFLDPTEATLAEYIEVCLPLYTRRRGGAQSPDAIRRIDVALHFVSGEWHTFDFTGELERIRCPTLVLAGACDPVTPREGAEELAAHVASDLVRFACFEDCGHNLLAERPGRVLALMEAFVRERDVAG